MNITRTKKLFGSGFSVISVKRRTFLQWLIMIVSLWSVVVKPVSVLPSPVSYLKFLPDGILLALMLLCFANRRITIKKDLQVAFQITGMLFCVCLVVYLFRYQSIAYFLWGFRNQFRFYIAFFSFIRYLDEDDINTWFKTMDALFWINVGLSVFQFFVLGISGDFLGGIFGVQGGSNGYTFCLMSIIVGKSLLEAFGEKKAVTGAVLKCITAIFIAVMAELKFFFFIMIFLLVGSAMITHFSVKKVVFLLLGFAAVTVGALLLVEWFEFEFAGFFSLEQLWKYATKENYSSQNDINRLSAISSLIQRFDLTPMQQLFGLGLGNCDTSSFAICNTPFYRQYGYLHYTWFTSAMVFLETGFLGLALYTGFFIACFSCTYKRFKLRTGNQINNQLAILIAIFCLIMSIYDSSLRVESGYMLYFILALPFIRQPLNHRAQINSIEKESVKNEKQE